MKAGECVCEGEGRWGGSSRSSEIRSDHQAKSLWEVLANGGLFIDLVLEVCRLFWPRFACWGLAGRQRVGGEGVGGGGGGLIQLM